MGVEDQANNDGGQQQGGQQQQQQQDGQQQSTDSMQKLLDISNATNLDDAVKWAENANSRLGSSINLPSEANAENNALIQSKLEARGYNVMLKPDTADPAQMKALNAMLGVPEEVAGYKLPEMTDDFKYNQEAADDFAKRAHKYGLTQSQMEGLLRDNATTAMSQQADYLSTQSEAMNGLKAELGFAYDEKMAAAEGMFKMAHPDREMKDLPVEVIQGFIRIAEANTALAAEGTNFGRSPEQSRMSPDEAKAEIMGVTQKLLEMKPNDTGYQELMDKKRALYKQAYPSSGKNDGTGRVGGVKFA